MSSVLQTLSGEDRTALSALDSQQEKMLKRVLSWAAVNTGSANVSGLLEFAPLLQQAFSVLDADIRLETAAPIERIRADGQLEIWQTGPVLTARARPNAPVQVVLTGHYDTVFPAGTFENIIELPGGKINGPGVADMKGGLVLMLEALRIFEAGPLKQQLGYRVVISPDEETGNFASATFLRFAATGAHVGLTFEPAMEGGLIAAARKGSAIFDVIFRGRSAHAGREPEAGRSAMLAAAAFVVSVEKLDKQMQDVTFNIGRIDGGGPVNAVPDLAIVRVGARAPDQRGAHWASQALRDEFTTVLKRDGISGEFKGGFHRPPKPKNAAQSQLLAALTSTAKAIDIDINVADTGGVCEGNNIFAAGVPNIDTLGVRGGNIHSSDEFLIPESLTERTALTLLLLNRLADGRIDAPAIKAMMEEQT